MNLHFEGNGTEDAAQELARFFDREFGATPNRVETPSETESGKRVDPVALAALILSVPGAILATMDLAERVRLREKIARLIALCRRQKESNGATVRLETAGGLRDLADLTPDQVLDAAARKV